MMQLSDLFEGSALGVFVLGIYWLAGRGAAALAASVVLLVIGFALDGIQISPHRRISSSVAWVRSKVKRGHE